MAWCVANAKIEQRANRVLVIKQAIGTAKIDALAATLSRGVADFNLRNRAIFLFCDAQIAQWIKIAERFSVQTEQEIPSVVTVASARTSRKFGRLRSSKKL
jgi:hypothetical protein